MPLFRLALSILLVIGLLSAPAPHDNARADTKAPVSIIADYQQTGAAFDHGKYLNANEGGYLTHKALSWLPESYPQFREAGLRMVTITHLLNENFYHVVRGTPPNLSYDFSKLDRVVLPLVEQGMTPVMGVAFTPQALGGADHATGFSNAIPDNNALWGQVVRAMVQHYKDLGHTGWYWEVWNEPDLGPHSFWAGTQAQFNLMYQATAAGVKAADPTAKIGGPATTQGGWTFFDGFTEFLRTNPGVPLDFASYHSYGENAAFGMVDQAKTRLDAAGRVGVPIFVTEWNITPDMTGGAGAPPDTNQNASYAVRRMADAMRRPAVSKIFWFTPKEGLQPSTLFNGDLGLVTVDGHKKAAYNAFQLVNRLQSTVINSTVTGLEPNDTTVGSIVTKDPASGKVVLLAWNDRPAGTAVDLRLSQLPHSSQQQVRVTQYLIDATHANYYKDYADGLRGWSVGPTENADPVDSKIIPGQATFNRTLTLGPHSVMAFVLERTTAAATNEQLAQPTAVPVGTRNLAHGRPVTSSSAVPWGWSPARLVDGLTHSFLKVDAGSPSNGWSSNLHSGATVTEWASVDLGYSAAVSRVKLFPRDDKDCEGYGFPIDFAIEGSDDAATWSTLLTRMGYNQGSPLPVPIKAQTFELPQNGPGGTHRYLRVRATKLQTACAGDPSRAFQLAEIQVESDTDLAARGARAAAGPVTTVRLPEPVGISRADLVPAATGAGLPRSFKIQVARGDCSSWSTVAVVEGQADPGRAVRTVGFPSQTVRCLRVRAADDQALRLADLRLYH